MALGSTDVVLDVVHPMMLLFVEAFEAMSRVSTLMMMWWNKIGVYVYANTSHGDLMIIPSALPVLAPSFL